MKLLSCYKTLQADNLTAGGIGQGGGGYWEYDVGQLLQQELAEVLGAEEWCLKHRPHGKDSFDRHPYDPPVGPFDIAYCQLFEIPTRRPADFVYSIISDYIGMEAVLEDFLQQVKPNLMISFQYPLVPPESLPGLPQLGRLPDLVEQCEAHGCTVAYLPWFNTNDIRRYEPDKPIAGMCTGKMSGTYPFRDAAWRYLQAMGRDDIVVSGNATGSTFSLSDEDYRKSLATTRYYFSGGIYGLQIPPKYYEVCNYGACLVSPDMPMMEASGFIPNETYLPIKSVEQIPEILERDDWKRIAPAGQRMVHERHGIRQRAEDIAQLYRTMTRRTEYTWPPTIES